MSDSCTVTIQRTESGYLVRLAGRGTLRESPTIRDFVSSALERGANIVLDLCRCEYLDSTFLGCLVVLHKRGATRPHAFSVLADDSARSKLLATARLHQVLFFVAECPGCAGDPVELPLTFPEPAKIGQHVLETHQRLAELGGPAADAFRRVAEQVSKELAGQLNSRQMN